MAVALDQLVLLVGPLEREEGLSQILDRVEPADPEQVLLQRPDEQVGTADAFGGAGSFREGG